MFHSRSHGIDVAHGCLSCWSQHETGQLSSHTKQLHSSPKQAFCWIFILIEYFHLFKECVTKKVKWFLIVKNSVSSHNEEVVIWLWKRVLEIVQEFEDVLISFQVNYVPGTLRTDDHFVHLFPKIEPILITLFFQIIKYLILSILILTTGSLIWKANSELSW